MRERDRERERERDDDAKRGSVRVSESGGGKVASPHNSRMTKLFFIMRQGEASKRSREEERMGKRVEREHTSPCDENFHCEKERVARLATENFSH